MTADPLTFLCAVLRGEPLNLPAGQAAARIIDLARGQRVHLVLAWQLRKHDSEWAEGSDEAARLAADVRIEALLDELRVRELGRVLAALEDGGLAPVVFKGSALAHSHYVESWLRPRLDSDILIDPDARLDAFERLKALGYTRPAFISGDLVMHQAPFIRVDDNGVEHVLDVHWRIANPQLIAGVLSHNEIRDQGRTIAVGGCSFRVPSATHSLLLACLHRAAHHNDDEELLWLYDIHLLAERLDSQEWRQFATLASDRAVRAICARGVSLSVQRFQTAVPRKAMATLVLEGRGTSERSAVYLKKDLRQIDRLASDLRVLGPRAGARLVKEHLFPPTSYMQEMYGVHSKALLPAFYLRRIVAGVSKWLRPNT